jgi:glucosamine--fructose-6-phosphate aminotransferase (isomerizing)
MCGIVGYIGSQEAVDILLNGLSRLEYRGYDSAGVAIYHPEQGLQIRRSVGKLKNLKNQIKEQEANGKAGIGHTRWATHGKPSETNAHPHTIGNITVVHNGIIENHNELRDELKKRGATFISETDTEIFSHLINEAFDGQCSLFTAVQKALSVVRGSYALVVFSPKASDMLVAARQGSPMVVGLGEGECFLASDVTAMIDYTRKVIFLEEGDRVILRKNEIQVFDAQGQAQSRAIKHITWSPSQAEKGGYKHFMLKEIFEQPQALIDTCVGRIAYDKDQIELSEIQINQQRLNQINRIYISACGTAWHAGLVGKRILEQHTRIPVEVDLASEFRYRDPVVDENTMFIAVSQSGETADTYAALQEAKQKGAYCMSICNVLESSIARLCDDVLYTHAGPEISVASTKAFVTQVLAFILLSLDLGKRLNRNQKHLAENHFVSALSHLPKLIEQTLELRDEIRKIAKELMHSEHCLFLGRGPLFPIALEGALKLKELSYIHAEGYAAGEMKHGPIALIDEQMFVVVLALQNQHYEKTVSNLQEVKARGGKVIAIATQGDEQIKALCEYVLYVPHAPEYLQPLMATIPLQILAYDVADLKGTDVDQPRNLAKSVTVE